MLKNLKRAAAIALSFAMAIQFGLADSYYANVNSEQPVVEQQEQTQEQEPTTVEDNNTAQEQTNTQAEQPVAETQAQPETKSIELSYVSEEGETLQATTSKEYTVDYALYQDANVMLNFDGYTLKDVIVNNEQTIPADQACLNVTSDMTSVKFVYKKNNTEVKENKTNENTETKTEEAKQEEEKTEEDTEADSDVASQDEKVQLTEFFVVASKNQVTKGGMVQMTLTIQPEDYPNKDVTWSSSNEDVATVDQNGLVTTKEVGTVQIRATLNRDNTIYSSATIVVNPIKVNKITISGYTKEYLTVNDTVDLKANVEPSDAANKNIIWESSDEKVATVDQNGKVTAKGQGTVSIKAKSSDSNVSVYGEQKITVYSSQPITKSVHVWVTNENENKSYQILIPADGTKITPSSVAQNTSNGSQSFITNAQFRVIDSSRMTGTPVWKDIQEYNLVKAFRYQDESVQYTTDGTNWKNISSGYEIYDFSSLKYTPSASGSKDDTSTGVNVILGDWPYGNGVATGHNRQTIQIQVLNTEEDKTSKDYKVYDSGVMRYDNGSNGQYGKIDFNCNTSKYKVTKVDIYQNTGNGETLIDTKYDGDISSISVKFKSNQTNHYRIVAYLEAKTINVNYDANGGTGVPKETKVKSTGNVTVDSSTRPTRDGYIFTGWAYSGNLYQGGETFEAPAHDVTFVAQWVKESDVINYTVNDSKMGSVSNTYERIGGTVQGNIQGSTAIAKPGYQFVKWVEETNLDGNAVSTEETFKPTKKGTYMAVFEAVTSPLVIRYVDTAGKEISASVTHNYKYGEAYTENAKDIKGYRLVSEKTVSGTKGVGKEEITFKYEMISVTVIISVDSIEYPYDGKPHSLTGYHVDSIIGEGYTVDDFKLAEGITANVTQTNAGSYPMNLSPNSFVNTNKAFKDVTFVVTDGSLTITPKSIVPDTPETPEDQKTGITVSEPKNHKYDGQEHKEVLTVKDTKTGKELVSGTDYDVEYSADVVNAGTVTITITGKGNYTGSFTKTYQITKRSITLTSESDKKVYDGEPLKNGTVTVSGDGFAEGEGATYSVTGSQTNEGSSLNEFGYTLNSGTLEGNYEITKKEGTLEVTSKSIVPDGPDTPEEKKTGIKVEAPTDSKYDGEEHRNTPKVTDEKTDKELVENVDYTLTYPEDIKNAGEVKVTVKGKGNYKGEFEVSYEITKRSVTLTSASDSKTYDGTALERPTVNVSGDGFVKGEGATYDVTGSRTKAGSSKNTFTYQLKNGTLASNYEITQEYGDLTVNPVGEVTVFITGHSKEVSYDGKQHTVKGYDVSISDSKYKESDFTFNGTASISESEVNAYWMGLKAEQFTNNSENFKKVTFIVTDGSLTITPKSIVPDTPETPEDQKTGITVSEPKNHKYDGQEHKEVLTVKDTKTGKELVSGTDYDVEYSADVVNAGTVTITITGKGNYTGSFTKTYQITKRSITLTSESDKKVYDGEPLKNGTVTVSGDGFAEGEGATYSVTGSQTNEGSSLNEFGYTLNSGTLEGNYEITKKEGTLEVTSKSIVPDGPDTPEEKKTGIKVEAPTDSKYDGEEHRNTPKVTDEKTDKELVENVDYTLTYPEDIKNAGEVKVTVKGKGNYKGEFEVSYEITKRSVTLTSASDSKTYDGTALERPTVNVSGDGFVTGEVSNIKANGSVVEGGKSVKNNITYTEETSFNKDNYDITVVEGTLSITKQSIDPGTDPEKPDPDYDGIEINSPSDVVYDGAEHKWIPSVKDKNGNALSETDYTVSYDSNDFTDVGTINVTIKGIGNYTGTVTRTYQITPRKYTITTLGGTKVYDGRALTNFGMVEGIVSGETYSFRTTGSQTEVGSSDNTYEFEWGTAKKSNYVLDKESIGKLVVTAKSIIPDTPDTPDSNKTGITVSDPSDSKYDGTEHREVLTVKDTKTGKDLVSGTDYDVAYSNDLVNAGTVTITVTGKGNYSGSFTKTYKITKRSVTLTSANATKTYDGTALTNNSIEVSGDGFVKGEGATYVVTGTQTNVGNSANSFEYTLNENTLASNYSVTKVVGTLRITRATTPVTPATPTTPSTPSTPLPSVIQRIVNVFNPTPAPSENVETDRTPKANREIETVEEDYTPKATRKYYWALINLICAILTVLFGLLLLISKRHKNKDDDDEEEDDETKQATKDTDEDEEEEESEKKRGLFTRVLAVLIAIISVVLFLLTEDMSLPWVWVDKWTVWMVVIGLVQIVVFFVGRKWKKVDDDEEDEEQAQQA